MALASRTMPVLVVDLEQTAEVAYMMMVAFGDMASGIQPGMALHGHWRLNIWIESGKSGVVVVTHDIKGLEM
jgi:hypothetical protein